MSFGWQEDHIAALRTRLPRALLGQAPGLGKSRISLMAAEGRTLLVAPSMILDTGNWTDEHAKWRPDLDLTQVSYSNVMERVRGEKKFSSIPTEALRPDLRGHWDTVIFDEAHYLKGRKTKWTLAALQVRADRAMLLTGTPIPNWAHELFVSLQLIYPEEAHPGGRFGSFWRWAREWFNVGATQFSPMAVGDLRGCTPDCEDVELPGVCAHWQAFRDATLGERALWREREEGDLPPMTEVVLMVDLTPAQATLYRRLKKEYIAWVEETGNEVIAWNKGALNVQLDMLTTGIQVLDPGATRGSSKLDMFRTKLEEQHNPSFAVAHYKESVRAASDVGRALGMRVATVDGDTSKKIRSTVIRDFQAGRFDLLCGSLETVAEGLTLTRADTVHFLEHSYKPSRNEQALRRIHRIGQTRPVTCYRYIARGTIDERKQGLLRKKTDHQMRALPARELAALL